MSDPTTNVLLLTDRFEVRGSSRQTLFLAEHLPELGISSRILCPDARRMEPRLRKRLDIIEMSQLKSRFISRVAWILLARDLASDPPDLIHIQQRTMMRLGRWLAARLRRPYVLTVHDYLRPGETFRFDRIWGRQIIAVSDSVRAELLQRTGLPPELVTVIPSGVEVEPAENIAPVLDEGHTPVVGTAGPLEATKGFRFFLQAVPKVLKVHPQVEFLIAGAGPEEPSLRRQARELEVAQRVTFVPNLYDFDRSLDAMDLFVLPSLKQGLGTVMLQAMARGKPVIATRAGGVYSVVSEGETGLLVPPSDSEALARRINELLSDPLLARRIATAARNMVQERFPVTAMVEKTAEVYREILGADPNYQKRAADRKTKKPVKSRD
ncbi:glycosyltransferase family 4 protein [Maioricimonas sp. JC845]|uniref:glycosyltransferase family 4 protein n=1 Tax=Maioricimonas sp. JC845 TaxID=3232138 RepID=UPI00345A9351